MKIYPDFAINFRSEIQGVYKFKVFLSFFAFTLIFNYGIISKDKILRKKASAEFKIIIQQ